MKRHNEFKSKKDELEMKNDAYNKFIELKNNEIGSLKKELSTKDKIISKLQAEKEKIKQELQKFKGFWCSLMKQFHNKIG